MTPPRTTKGLSSTTLARRRARRPSLDGRCRCRTTTSTRTTIEGNRSAEKGAASEQVPREDEERAKRGFRTVLLRGADLRVVEGGAAVEEAEERSMEDREASVDLGEGEEPWVRLTTLTRRPTMTLPLKPVSTLPRLLLLLLLQHGPCRRLLWRSPERPARWLLEDNRRIPAITTLPLLSTLNNLTATQASSASTRPTLRPHLACSSHLIKGRLNLPSVRLLSRLRLLSEVHPFTRLRTAPTAKLLSRSVLLLPSLEQQILTFWSMLSPTQQQPSQVQAALQQQQAEHNKQMLEMQRQIALLSRKNASAALKDDAGGSGQ